MASYIPTEENGSPDMHSAALTELKALGVKVPKLKKLKSIIAKQEVSVPSKGSKIFGVSLSEQEWLPEGRLFLPKFIVMITSYLTQFISQEIGLFRKAGNFSRQRKLRSNLERGSEDFQNSDPNDVASVLKQWLRELPEPLIPSYAQDVFIRCQNLKVDESRISACLFAFLLLPTDHMHTLKHLLQFLSKVALNSDKNKMGSHNLALIMAPNIFVPNEPLEKEKSILVYQHTAIIEILIENANIVGDLPALSIPQPIIESELNLSDDQIDFAPTKSKKKSKSGTVQDIFSGFLKKVGQNLSFSTKSTEDQTTLRTPYLPRSASKRKAEPDLAPSSTKKKHLLSVDPLDSPFTTPKTKSKFANLKKNISGKTRRTSFGALLLRRKEKKRSENQTPEFDRSRISNISSTDMEEKNSKPFNFSLSKSDLEGVKFQFNQLNLDDPISRSLFKSEYPSIASTSSDKTSINYNKICKLQIENKSEVFSSKLPSKTQNPVLNTKAKQADISNRSGLTRKEAFNIKPMKKTAQNLYTNKPQNKRENQIKSRGSLKRKNSATFNPHSSFCNNKCDKNKTHTGKGILKEKNKQSDKSRPANRNQCSQETKQHLPIVDGEFSKSTRQSSYISSDIADPSRLNSKVIEQNTVKYSEPQSLDLSLNLLLQNFCISPPTESSAIRLNIDITSTKHNKGLKVNISNETVGVQRESRRLHKIDEISGVQKTCKRLSSNSDRLIPRLKKNPETNRPTSFSGSIRGYKYKFKNAEANVVKSSKIPVMLKENKTVEKNIPSNETNKEDEVTSNGIFKTPEKDTCSEDWKSGNLYFNTISPFGDKNSPNKRESIARLLKESPGNVRRKISLYDSKHLSTCSSNSDIITEISPEKVIPSSSELFRASSEKYASRHRYNRLKLTTTNSYDLVSRSSSLKSNTTFQRPNIQASGLISKSPKLQSEAAEIIIDDAFTEDVSNKNIK